MYDVAKYGSIHVPQSKLYCKDNLNIRVFFIVQFHTVKSSIHKSKSGVQILTWSTSKLVLYIL